MFKKIFYNGGIMPWKTLFSFKPTFVWGPEVSHEVIGEKGKKRKFI